MGVVSFVGCVLIAVAPVLALIFTIFHRKHMLSIYAIGSAFFFLLAIIASSLVWWMIPPLRTAFAWAVFIGVLLQESARYGFWKVFRKAQERLNLQPAVKLRMNYQVSVGILASGTGIAAIYALIMYGSVLWDSLGPGTLPLPGCFGSSIYFISALYCLCFVSFHILASVISFEAYENENKLLIGTIVGGHLLLSSFSILNRVNLCWLGLLLSYSVVGGITFISYRVLRNILSAIEAVSTVNASIVVPRDAIISNTPTTTRE